MSALAIACQVIIAFGIVNVWVFRRDRPSPYRPGNAANMKEEFERYGLPGWARIAVGGTKLALAAALLVGIVWSQVAVPAAALMGALMIGAVVMHIRVDDPLPKALPATFMLLLSAIVVASYTV
ncbi:MAG: DoxX family protein [Longimicrobiales bacterium]